MIDKPLFIIITMYCVSFMALAGQFVIGDVLGLTLTNYNGDELKTPLVTAINQGTINSVFATFTNSSAFTIVDVAGAFIAAADVLVQLLIILTGLYIFHIMWFLLGADATAYFIVAGFTIPYGLLLGNTIIAKIRGI